MAVVSSAANCVSWVNYGDSHLIVWSLGGELVFGGLVGDDTRAADGFGLGLIGWLVIIDESCGER